MHFQVVLCCSYKTCPGDILDIYVFCKYILKILQKKSVRKYVSPKETLFIGRCMCPMQQDSFIKMAHLHDNGTLIVVSFMPVLLHLYHLASSFLCLSNCLIIPFLADVSLHDFLPCDVSLTNLCFLFPALDSTQSELFDLKAKYDEATSAK